MQYFRKGLVVAARNRKCLLNKIKVEIFQLMMNMAMEAPTIAELIEFTFPRYSGARYNESAPNVFMNDPLTVAKSTNQNKSRAWYFLKCRNSNCIGNER